MKYLSSACNLFFIPYRNLIVEREDICQTLVEKVDAQPDLHVQMFSLTFFIVLMGRTLKINQ